MKKNVFPENLYVTISTYKDGRATSYLLDAYDTHSAAIEGEVDGARVAIYQLCEIKKAKTTHELV